ncbi:MBL fold metallo-hydrolase [Peptoclostridium litorale]|nr:MBL fold metallo-hydrolase [Peptoclostridium litorale]
MEKIAGHSYYIRGGTNTGVYLFKDKYALIVDPGLTNSKGHRIIKHFEENGIRARAIVLTHEHYDHYGASCVITDHFTGALTYSSNQAKIFIENPHIFSSYVYGGRTNNVLEKSFSQKGAGMLVDDTLSEGQLKIGEKKFEIHSLPGHSPGHIGISTEDKVLYLGDSLFNESILRKYKLPFLFDIGAQLESLEKMKTIDFEHCVLAHEKALLQREEALKLIDINKSEILSYLGQAVEFLNSPMTREDLVKDIIEYNDMEIEYKQYYFTSATVGSMISYLLDRDVIGYEIEGGGMYYYKK